MIQFNPYLRNTAAECLKSPYFDNMRVKELEQPAPFKIFLKIDKDEACDYESGQSIGFSKIDFINMILEEVSIYRKQKMQRLFR